MYITDKIQVYNESCFSRMAVTADESIDIICVDPPYLYLKHKLDIPFDETLFFNECKRLLTKNGFIILFGRGASFYRWGARLYELGFTFKEEIIWDKSQCSSPLMALSRVHETVSIWTKGKGIINKCKIPYLEMKAHDLDSVVSDIKRMRSILNNTKSLNAVLDFLESDMVINDGTKKNIGVTVSSNIDAKDRSASVIAMIDNGCVEKSIITQYQDKGLTISSDAVGKVPDSVVDMNKIVNGMSEKSIINYQDEQLVFIKNYYYQLLELLQDHGQTTIYEELRDHYTAVHPTQKPVRLLERLLQLVIPKNKPISKITVADWFGGSYSTMRACHNLCLNGISTEIEADFHNTGFEETKNHCHQLNLFAV